MSTRVYLTGDWERFGEVLHVDHPGFSHHNTSPRDYDGHAVTPALRAACPDWDEEQLEHYAMTEAAQASLHHLPGKSERMRRLVITVDAAVVEPVVDGLTAVVAKTVSLPKDVAAVMVDTEDAEARVAAAVSALRGADDIEADDVRRSIDRCLDHELAWFAATEIDQVFGRGPHPEPDPL